MPRPRSPLCSGLLRPGSELLCSGPGLPHSGAVVLCPGSGLPLGSRLLQRSGSLVLQCPGPVVLRRSGSVLRRLPLGSRAVVLELWRRPGLGDFRSVVPELRGWWCGDLVAGFRSGSDARRRPEAGRSRRARSSGCPGSGFRPRCCSRPGARCCSGSGCCSGPGRRSGSGRQLSPCTGDVNVCGGVSSAFD